MKRPTSHIASAFLIAIVLGAVTFFSAHTWISVRKTFDELNNSYIPVLDRATDISVGIAQARTELFRYVNKYEPSPFRVRKRLEMVQSDLLWIRDQNLPQGSISLAKELFSRVDRLQKDLNKLESYVEARDAVRTLTTANQLTASGTILLSLAGKFRQDLWDQVLLQNMASQKRLLRNNAFLTGISLIVILILVAGMLFRNRLLSREVQARTLELQNRLKDLRESETALQESETKFRELTELLPQTVFETDTKGRLTYANEMGFQSFGYTPKELEKGLHVLDMIIPEDQKKGLERIKTILISQKPTSAQYTALRKDGTTFSTIMYSTPIRREGKVLGVRGIIADITKQKEAEAENARLTERLHRAQKMEALGLLAGGVAHDLNNILSGIVSYPELILMDLPEDSPLRKPIQTIQASGNRASDVVSDLLTIARGVAVGKEPMNLNTLIHEYLDSPEFHKLKGMHPLVRFNTDLDSDLLNVKGSPIHIKKSLMNLVTNAAEAMENGGEIVISSRNRYLDRPIRGYDEVRQGEYVVLRISDQGSGITSKDLDKIFEPFYTRKVMGRSGTGLGLTVVWNIVQDHDGYINVHTGTEGTAFELFFPVSRQTLEQKSKAVSLSQYMGHGEKLLVVDDEENQREIACEILHKLGYRPASVPSGEAAVDYVKAHSVDLIVLDMVMPKGMDGLQTYEEILKVRPGQKVVIASGYAKTEAVAKAQKLKAGAYVKKPYTLEKIGLAVREELEKM